MQRAVGLSFVVFLISSAFSRAALAETSGADRVIVVTISASAPELDPAPLRAAIGRELHLEAIGPDDDRARGAAGHLDVAVDRPARQIVVTYRGGAELLVRRVDWPADRDATTRVVAMLAGNLGRDEAGELAGSLRIQVAPAPSATPAPERADQEPKARKEPYVLALNRLELRPGGGWAIAWDSVTGAFVGADVAFRMSRVFALGADVAWYAPFNGSAGAHPWYPLNETEWSADLDAYVVPWPARGRASAAIGAFEPYLLGGIGLLASRPVAVIDPVNRHFSDNKEIDFAVGVGARLFLTELVAITLEVRDLMYFEHNESLAVASNPANPATWYSPNTNFTNSVQIRLGASFFVP